MSNRETVVMIHGLWANKLTLFYLARQLKKQGYQTTYFSYSSMRHSLDENARQLRHFIEKLNVDCCHLVGHSLGGMIILNFLQKYLTQNVSRAVLLGSPVNGSKVAFTLANNRFFSWSLGGCSTVLAGGFEYSGKYPVGVIAGSGGMGFGHLLTHIDPPHDGAVMVSEASLHNASDLKILPTSHFSMLLSKAVALNIGEYLRAGRFFHDD